ncbi:hypothetical protein FSP39_009858 [Pinctada imbricata]|uniref:Ciliary microtubule inner protein 2A-C-like domain-containing protein n=1 Tax=Pinctada imbricata TaxID=66713 RepID=A0AA89BN99_PINIB|nr:hypothetical protein FSP39_009858 [Pinctada imbricata]
MYCDSMFRGFSYRYGGFCPQFKYRIGETFGKTTCKLLQEPGVASSGRLVLANLSLKRPLEEEELRTRLLKDRQENRGDQKLVQRMVPGYTGFIPKSQHFFGKRYAMNCQSAIADFESDQQDGKGKAEEIKTLSTGPASVSLKPVPRELRMPVLNTPVSLPKSPYYLPRDDPKKNFMSGYTGFVPRSRGQLGRGYPIITNLALNEFTDDIRSHSRVLNEGVCLKRPKRLSVDTMAIYPIQSGLVPHYTGHIPGQKFRYGQTFGHSTENALKQQTPVST